VKRFNFPLERVLRLRHQETEMSRIDLAGALQRHAEAGERLRSMARLLAETTERTVAHRQLSAADFAQGRRHVNALFRQREKLEHSLAEAKDEVDRKRRDLVERRRLEQVLEKLRERRLQTWRDELSREGQNVLDEISQSARPPFGAGGMREDES
jgi:flagellar protein FliJ